MRVCVVGAGAIGSLLGGRLAVSGNEVSLLTRGDHLAAIRRSGLEIVEPDGSATSVTSLAAADDLDAFGPQDLVIVALKAHQIAAVAPRLPHLYGDETVVMPVQNGIPWWFFQGFGGEHEGHRLESLDPDGILEDHIPAGRIIGSIAYPAAERPSPGVVRVIEGDKFPVGELDGSRTDRVEALAEVLTKAGFSSRVVTNLRTHLWVKAWGNLAFNPISALTRATLAEICRFPATRALAAAMMEEASAVAEALGLRLPVTIEKRIAAAEAVGEHRTSMLQDVEAGHPLELEPLVGVFRELGALTGVPTPNIEAVYACTKLMERVVITQRN